MAMKSVLIIGGSGFVGTHLALKLRENYKVFATYVHHPIRMRGVTCIPFDADNADKCKRQLYMAAPDVVIYAAGKNNLDWAEEFGRDAEKVHVNGPSDVLKLTTIFQPKFIYLSSCYAFDGNRGNYRETDNLSAQKALGKIKLAAEGTIKGRSAHYTILRLAPIYGRGNGMQAPSFVDQLRISLAKSERIELEANQIHNYMPASYFTEVIVRLIEGGPRNKTFHVGGLTKCSQLEFAKAFARRFGYDPNLILEKRTIEPPADYSLNSTAIVQLLKLKPLLLDEGFDLLEKELVPGT